MTTPSVLLRLTHAQRRRDKETSRAIARAWEETVNEPQPAVEKQSPYRWYVLGVLVCIYMLHHLDRMVLSLLQEPIKHEFNLADWQLGLISGTAYAVAFGIAGLPLGMMVDRFNRVRLLAVILTIWSGLTAFASTATHFMTLFAVRIGVGAEESGGTPANLSLISDYFAKGKRSTAIGIYMVGSQLGTLVGFAITGVIAVHYGWRAALLVAGIPGLIMMLVLIFTVREPVRQTVQTGSPLVAFKTIAKSPILIHLIAALTLANVVAPGISSWVPSFLIRTHHMDMGSVGLTLAATIYPFSTLATILAGMATDKFAARNVAAMYKVMAGAAFLIVPIVIVGVLSGSLWVALAMFCIQHVLHMFISTPGHALIMGYVPSNMRGTTAAILQVLSNLIGFGVGPMVGGALSDALQPMFGDQSLRYALAIFVFLSLWPCAHLLRALYLTRKGGLTGLEPIVQSA
jgi:MFS family permease